MWFGTWRVLAGGVSGPKTPSQYLENSVLVKETVAWDDRREGRGGKLMQSGIGATDALHTTSAERTGAIFQSCDDALKKNWRKIPERND
jgi:hypothetical protein